MVGCHVSEVPSLCSISRRSIGVRYEANQHDRPQMFT